MRPGMKKIWPYGPLYRKRRVSVRPQEAEALCSPLCCSNRLGWLFLIPLQNRKPSVPVECWKKEAIKFYEGGLKLQSVFVSLRNSVDSKKTLHFKNTDVQSYLTDEMQHNYLKLHFVLQLIPNMKRKITHSKIVFVITLLVTINKLTISQAFCVSGTFSLQRETIIASLHITVLSYTDTRLWETTWMKKLINKHAISSTSWYLKKRSGETLFNFTNYAFVFLLTDLIFLIAYTHKKLRMMPGTLQLFLNAIQIKNL